VTGINTKRYENKKKKKKKEEEEEEEEEAFGFLFFFETKTPNQTHQNKLETKNEVIAIMQSTTQVDRSYSDPFAIFSSETFYDFTTSVESYSQEPNTSLPVATAVSKGPSTSCSCCTVCSQHQQAKPLPQPQQSREPQYWQSFYSTKYPPRYQNPPITTPTPVFYTIYQEPSQPATRIQPPKSETIPLLRTLQNRLIWTKSLEKKFLLALDYFGLDNGESTALSPIYQLSIHKINYFV